MTYVCPTMENFKKLAGEMDVVLFGAGEYCMRFLNRIGDLTNRVKYIFDNDESKTDKAMYGIPIVSPARLKGLPEDKTLVVITAWHSIVKVYEQVLSMGDYTVMAGGVLMHPTFSNVTEKFYTHQAEIKQASEILYDDLSKQIYHEVIRRRALYGECDFSDLSAKSGIEYCPTFWFSETKPQDEVILDCGASIGDTLKKFTKIYGPALKRVYTFECMPQSLEKLSATAAHLSNMAHTPDIVSLPYALSDYEGKTVFAAMESSPGSSFVLENRPLSKTLLYARKEIEVNVSTIDQLVPKEEAVTQIKMDIEGSEYAALLGARETILRCKPKLAISIYHSGQDYYRLPLLVKEMVPEYKIAVRHHHKTHVDTDMYCWI